MKHFLIILGVCWLFSLTTQAQVARIEYFFDTDPGLGMGTAVAFPPSFTDGTISFNADISLLQDGFHTLYIRVKDVNGAWSHLQTRPFIKTVISAGGTAEVPLNRVEYFFDTDPGLGQGTAINIPAGATSGTFSQNLDLSGIADGFHTLYIRARNQNGAWSHLQTRPFIKTFISAGGTVEVPLNRVEYFFDTDPGLGQGTAINIPAGATSGTFSQNLDLSGIADGFHTLYIRARNQNGAWSHMQTRPFIKTQVTAGGTGDNMPIIAAEYFFDTDPGIGVAHPISLPENTGGDVTVAFDAQVAGLSIGTHILYVRAKSQRGWSHVQGKEVTVLASDLPPLAGTYTINAALPNSATNFPSVQAALDNLVARKTSAAVVFECASGTYNVNYSLGQISTADATKTITFKAASGASVVWTAASLSTTNNYILKFNGTSFLRFENLTFTKTGSNYGRIIAFAGTIQDLQFKNSVFNGLSNNGEVFYADAATLNQVRIENNTIHNGVTAFKLTGNGDAWTNTRIQGNSLSRSGSASGMGFDLTGISGVVLQQNWVNNYATALSHQNGGAMEVTRNKFIGAQQGVIVSGSNGASGAVGLFANNWMVVNATGTALSLQNSSHWSLYHNSLNAIAGTYAFSVSGTYEGVEAKNNIFALQTGTAVAQFQSLTGLSSDYNAFFRNGTGTILQANGSSFATLADFQSHPGTGTAEDHSIAANPIYTSNTNLHAQSDLLNGTGTSSLSVAINDDIDGESRTSLSPTDIGSDAFLNGLSPLSGTYNVGSGGDYATVQDALNARTTQGQTGNVVLQVPDNTHITTPLVINPTADQNTTHTVTLSGGGNSTITGSTGSGQNYLLCVCGKTNFRLSGFKLRPAGTEQRVIEITEPDIITEFVDVEVDGTNMQPTHHVIYVSNPIRKVVLTRFKIVNLPNTGTPPKGIYFDEITDGIEISESEFEIPEPIIIRKPGKTIKITKTRFTCKNCPSDTYELKFSGSGGVEFVENEVTLYKGGVHFADAPPGMRLIGNRITAEEQGIYLNNCRATADSIGVIANNFIRITGEGDTDGVRFNNSPYYRLYHNTIRMASSDPLSAAVKVEGTATHNLDLRNNIFYHAGAGTAFQADRLAAFSHLNYNAYWTASGPIARWAGTNYNTLTDWQAAVPSVNTHSVQFPIFFTSATDLHLTGASVGDGRLKGEANLPHPITQDIDKQVRNSPYMGADEALGTTLPILLTTFSAQVGVEGVTLNWQTAQELHTDQYVIERKMGNQWQEMGAVKALGTTSAPQTYRYQIKNLPPGRHVFRLRVEDIGGQKTFSPETELTLSLKGAYFLSAAYPNPFNPQTTFTLTVGRTQTVQVEVYDAVGRRVGVLHRGELGANEAHAFRIAAQGLSSGTYFIRATGEDFSGIQKVMLLK